VVRVISNIVKLVSTQKAVHQRGSTLCHLTSWWNNCIPLIQIDWENWKMCDNGSKCCILVDGTDFRMTYTRAKSIFTKVVFS
jgi:hypothetical protein